MLACQGHGLIDNRVEILEIRVNLTPCNLGKRVVMPEMDTNYFPLSGKLFLVGTPQGCHISIIYH